MHRRECMRGHDLGADTVSTSQAEEVAVAAGLVEDALSRQSEHQCAEVIGAAAECERVFGRHAAAVRLEALARLKVGDPPSMRQIVGVSDLEVPMNRALAWVFDEHVRGSAARRGLLALAKLLDFPELERDIAAGSPLSFYAESSPDPDISTRRPDFLIGSPNAAVLVENKVWSPESGPDQYSHYLHYIETWAGARAARAYLLARDEGRTTPHGWERCVSHRELADALRPLTTDADLSFWDRVIYSLVVSDLDPDQESDRHGEIRQLIEGGHALSEVAVVAKLSKLLRRPTIDPTNGSN